MAETNPTLRSNQHRDKKRSLLTENEKNIDIPGQYIIRFLDELSADQVEATANQVLTKVKALMTTMGVNTTISFNTTYFYKDSIKGFELSNFPDQWASLFSKIKEVVSIDQDYKVDLNLPNVTLDQDTSIPDDSDVATASNVTGSRNLKACSNYIPWGVKRVGGPIKEYNGTARVFVIDTGVKYLPDDLNIDSTLSRDFTGIGSWEDEDGHGTHVAGTIAGKCRVLGVVPGATIISLRVLNATGGGDMSWSVQAVNYVARIGKSGDVVNMSLGGKSFLALDNAITNAAKKGIRFSIAAGNDHVSADSQSPARVQATNVFTISAMDSGQNLASFSNYGNPPVDFAAPGVGISSLSMSGSTTRKSGTSMAAPHVAGLLLVGGVTSDGYIKSDKDATPDPIAFKNTILSKPSGAFSLKLRDKSNLLANQMICVLICTVSSFIFLS